MEIHFLNIILIFNSVVEYAVTQNRGTDTSGTGRYLGKFALPKILCNKSNGYI